MLRRPDSTFRILDLTLRIQDQGTVCGPPVGFLLTFAWRSRIIVRPGACLYIGIFLHMQQISISSKNDGVPCVDSALGRHSFLSTVPSNVLKKLAEIQSCCERTIEKKKIVREMETNMVLRKDRKRYGKDWGFQVNNRLRYRCQGKLEGNKLALENSVQLKQLHWPILTNDFWVILPQGHPIWGPLVSSSWQSRSIPQITWMSCAQQVDYSLPSEVLPMRTMRFLLLAGYHAWWRQCWTLYSWTNTQKIKGRVMLGFP